MAGHRITDWMLKVGLAEWDPNDRRPEPEPPQRPENPPKDGNR